MGPAAREVAVLVGGAGWPEDPDVVIPPLPSNVQPVRLAAQGGGKSRPPSHIPASLHTPRLQIRGGNRLRDAGGEHGLVPRDGRAGERLDRGLYLSQAQILGSLRGDGIHRGADGRLHPRDTGRRRLILEWRRGESGKRTPDTDG